MKPLSASVTGYSWHQRIDWSTEYLGLTVSVKLVSNLEEAIDHINQYGTKHSEAIITNNEQNAAYLPEPCRCGGSIP